MFSMEEEGSAKRPTVQRSAPNQLASSLSDANTSDDDDDDHFICPILDDSAKEICHYLKNCVYNRQLSNSLPKSNFMFRVSHCPSNKCWRIVQSCSKTDCIQFFVFMHHHKHSVLQFSVRTALCLIRRDDLCMPAHTYQYVCICLLKWNAGQTPLNSTLSKEQEVPEQLPVNTSFTSAQIQAFCT